MKFQNHYNRDQFPRGYEVNNEPSDTVPNQSLTVRELVYRFTHNMDLNAVSMRSYDQDDEIQVPANWNQLDLSEKMDFLQQRKDEAEGLLKNVERMRNEEENRKRDEEIERQVQIKLDAHKRAIQGGQNATPNAEGA